MRPMTWATSQDAKLVSLLSLAMRVLPLECAATPGLSSRLTALLQGRIESLECTLRDVRASQGIALLHGLESSVLFLRDQLDAVVGACGGLEQDVDDLSSEIEELRSKAAYDSEQISWLQESLAVARSAAAEQEAALRAREELVRQRESFRRNPSEPERLREPAAATAPRPLPVAGHRRSDTGKRCLPALPSASDTLAPSPTAPVTLHDDSYTQRGQRGLVKPSASLARYHSESDCASGDGHGSSATTAEPNAPVTWLATESELLQVVMLAQSAACQPEGSEMPAAPWGSPGVSVGFASLSHTHAPQVTRAMCVGAGSNALIAVSSDAGLGDGADSVHTEPTLRSSPPLASDALAISPIPRLATSPHWHLQSEVPLTHLSEGSESDEDAVRGQQTPAVPNELRSQATETAQSQSHGHSDSDSESAMMVIVTSGPGASGAGPGGSGGSGGSRRGSWSSSTDSLRAVHDEPLAAPLARRAGPAPAFSGPPAAGIIGRGAAGPGSRIVLPAEEVPAPFPEARALPLQPAGGGKQPRAAPGSSAGGLFSRAVLWI